MDILRELAAKPTFVAADITALCGNENTAKNFLGRAVKKGRIFRIRKNMYTLSDPFSGVPYANKFQIASAITKSSCVSHHTAFEYLGKANQVYYEVYVSSFERFMDFTFDGITYKFVLARIQDGIFSPKLTTGIRITELERTVVDSINDMDKIAGLEEVINCISSISNIDFKKIRKYLDAYDFKILYKKVGYILSSVEAGYDVPLEFKNYCLNKGGDSKRYISSDNYLGELIKEWNLIVPKNWGGAYDKF
ncbi:MAG: type IV toxin-antitoxin system AbiEi family antitoxin domain-containing protein [Anaerovoracaceae bacterium]